MSYFAKEICFDISFSMCRILCIILLLKPVLRGVKGSLRFPLPSMNRLNQTVPSTFAICCFGLSIGAHFFCILWLQRTWISASLGAKTSQADSFPVLHTATENGCHCIRRYTNTVKEIGSCGHSVIVCIVFILQLY